MAEGKKIRKPTKAEYRQAVMETALNFISIYECKNCGWPFVKGYCCNYCGSSDPE